MHLVQKFTVCCYITLKFFRACVSFVKTRNISCNQSKITCARFFSNYMTRAEFIHTFIVAAIILYYALQTSGGRERRSVIELNHKRRTALKVQQRSSVKGNFSPSNIKSPTLNTILS